MMKSQQQDYKPLSWYKQGCDKQEKQTQTFFELQANDIDGHPFHFSSLQGKKAFVVVNVACKCGMTSSQYKELVELYKQYQPLGLEILAFPCNQFKEQEPAPEHEIKTFVKQEFDVTFRLFEKVEVNGPNTHPLFQFLRQNSVLFESEIATKEIPWNFAKFLLNSQGQVVDFYHPKIMPSEMIPALNQMLGL